MPTCWAFSAATRAEAHIGVEAAERFLAQNIRREAALEAAEESLAREPRPSVESAIRWAVDLETSVNPSLLAESLALLFPKGPLAARAFRDGMSGHLRHLGELALRRAPDVRARERAEALFSHGSTDQILVLDPVMLRLRTAGACAEAIRLACGPPTMAVISEHGQEGAGNRKTAGLFPAVGMINVATESSTGQGRIDRKVTPRPIRPTSPTSW